MNSKLRELVGEMESLARIAMRPGNEHGISGRRVFTWVDTIESLLAAEAPGETPCPMCNPRPMTAEESQAYKESWEAYNALGLKPSSVTTSEDIDSAPAPVAPKDEAREEWNEVPSAESVERQPSKLEAEMAFDIVRFFQFTDEEKDVTKLHGSPTMLGIQIAKALARHGDAVAASAREKALEAAAGKLEDRRQRAWSDKSATWEVLQREIDAIRALSRAKVEK